MNRVFRNLSIRQSILAVTVAMVALSLMVSSFFYSTSFSRATGSLIESQAREINKQIILNYESYIKRVIESADYLQLSLMEKDLFYSGEDLERIFQLGVESNRDMVSITLYDLVGKNLISHGRRDPVQDEMWALRALADDSIYHFSPPHTMEDGSARKDQVISISKMVNYKERGEERRGIFLINLNFEAIEALSSQTNLGRGGHILMLGDDDTLIYTTLPSSSPVYEESFALARSHYFGGERVRLQAREMYLNSSTLIQTRWRIITMSNINELALARDRNVQLLFVIFFVSLIVALLVGAFISRRISEPLYQLEQAMYRMEEGDFFTPVEVTGQKEIVHLGLAFNEMLERIRTLMDAVVKEQRDRRKNELAALQNQINPHFLYNTLDSIVWLAENNRNKDVVTTVVALARFFRISISRGKNFIPVQDEISHIENYLTIQKIRYVDKFEYRMEIDEQVYAYKVMKLILQPLVENAIYHGGGEGDDEKGIITIRSYPEEAFLIFEVENSGYGVTQERIGEIMAAVKEPGRTEGVGLRNVYQRLKIYYGEEADLTMDSILDEMTRVRLVLPRENL
ncbi:MAG: sensor histidine kinase [Spirochaetales bacterium]|nr:sensor histidine kinase [Spirochaetales bacterium]